MLVIDLDYLVNNPLRTEKDGIYCLKTQKAETLLNGIVSLVCLRGGGPDKVSDFLGWSNFKWSSFVEHVRRRAQSLAKKGTRPSDQEPLSNWLRGFALPPAWRRS